MTDKAQIRIIGAVLAAGKSKRMGTDKLALKAAGGKSILDVVIDAAENAALDDLCVLIGDDKNEMETERGSSFVKIRSHGMAVSVTAALDIALSHKATHLMVILGDMPKVTADDINLLIAAARKYPGAIIRAAHAKKPGNPVILPLADAAAFKARLSGDEGARAIIDSQRYKVIEIECGKGVIMDIDTPASYEDYLRG